MTLRKRRLIFFLFFIVFILLGAFLVFYSQGWRFSFKNFSFQKTGAVYVESEPYDAGIEINGRPVKNKAWFFGGGTLITDIFPGSYEIEVFKEGYRLWKKNLDVFPSLVSSASSIILVPKEIPETEVKNGIRDFWISGGRLIWADEKGLWSEPNGKKIKLPGAVVANLRNDSDYLVTASADGIYFLVNLSRPESFLNLTALFNNLKERKLNLPGAVSIIKIISHPFDSNRLIVATKGALYLLDTARLTLEVIGESPIFAAVSGSEVVWASKGSVYSYHLLLRSKTTLIKNLKSSVSDVSSSGGYWGVLAEDGALFLVKGGEIKQIAHSAESFRFSPDGEKVAFLDRGGELKIYFLAEEEGLFKRAGSYAEPGLRKGAEAAEWYKDSFHLFIKYPGEIYFAEIDDRLPANFYAVADGLRFHYNAKKDFYVLKGNGRLITKKIF